MVYVGRVFLEVLLGWFGVFLIALRGAKRQILDQLNTGVLLLVIRHLTGLLTFQPNFDAVHLHK